MAKSSGVDQSDRGRLQHELQRFGLSANEANVYLALLPRRDTGSSKLVHATGLHKQLVYNALAKLEEAGLAKHVLQNGRKKFSPVTPKRLVSMAEEGRLAAQSVAKRLQTLYAGAHEHDFEVLQGEGAFVSYQFALMERTAPGSVIDVVSGPNDKYFNTLDEEGLADDFEELRIEKRIKVRYLGSPAVRQKLSEMEKWREYWTHRVFPGLSTGLVDMSIWPDCLVLNVFGSPLLCFVITGKEVAEGYREFFEAIWKLSSK